MGGSPLSAEMREQIQTIVFPYARRHQSENVQEEKKKNPMYVKIAGKIYKINLTRNVRDPYEEKDKILLKNT